jgi:hypothetical protein
MASTPSQSQGDPAEVITAASTTEWPGGLFLPPPEPREATDGSERYEGVTYAATFRRRCGRTSSSRS